MQTIYNNQGSSSKEAQGELKGDKRHDCLWGLLGLSPLRADGSQGSQPGRLDHVSNGHRQLKVGIQARVHSDQMVLVTARQGGLTG